MSDPFDYKAGLLQAIADGGTRAAQAYKDAQTQLAQQQQTATQAALAGSVALSPGAQASVQGIIGTGYAPRQASLTQNAATSADYFNKLGANSNAFIEGNRSILPLLEAQIAAKMAGSGGGGGGGGKKSGAADWEKALAGFGGSQGYQREGILAAAANYGDSSTPLTVRARDYAVNQLGVPDYVAKSLIPDSKYLTAAQKSLQTAKNPNLRSVKTGLQTVLDTTKSGSRVYPWTVQSPVERRYVVSQARTAGVPTYAAAKKKKGK